MGMSPVHMNRSLQALRGQDLVIFKSRQLVIPDIDRLREMAQFNPNYLHLDGGKRDIHPNYFCMYYILHGTKGRTLYLNNYRRS